jgi:glycerophosphoryl diester phosphodiesterase
MEHHSPLPFVLGHRGAAALEPENTLESLRRAKREGARWVEFDVKLCKGNDAVLFHDDTLHRTTSGEGIVADVPLTELQELDAGGWFGAEFAGYRVPTLSEAFVVLNDEGLGANIEIKPSAGASRETARVVCDAVREMWPAALPKPLISSFDIHALEVVRDKLPETQRAVLFYALPTNWRAIVASLQCSSVHLMDSETTLNEVAELTSAGFALRVFTVNDAVRAATLRQWGVQSVFTDRPDLIKD